MSSAIVFWLAVAALLALTLARVLPALWRRREPADASLDAGGANVAVYRDQLREAERDLAADLITPERFAQTQAEIQRRVLEDTAAASKAAAAGHARTAAVVLSVLIPLGSVATYLVIGSPQIVAAPAALEANHQATPAQIEAMLGQLAQRLKDKPDDPQGWHMLGRSYLALERFDDAIAALRKGLAVQPDNADMLTDLADAIARTSDRQLAGEPTALLERALAANPQHGKALALAGSAAFAAGQFALARERWSRLLAMVPPESAIAQSINEGIARATAQLGAAGGAAAAAAPAQPPSSAAETTAAASPAAAAATAVSGEVVLDPALAARVAPGDTLFVFVRAAQGPKAPLAAMRRTAGELPLTYSLDDRMAMTPNLKISSFDQVQVVARISKSGQAMAQSGDLIGQSAPIRPGTRGVKVVISGVLP